LHPIVITSIPIYINLTGSTSCNRRWYSCLHAGSYCSIQ